MNDKPNVICIGAILWDVIGRAARDMPYGADRPGRISRLPGGVALNIAMALAHRGLSVELLAAVGRDHAGQELLEEAIGMGLGTDYVTKLDALPTDIYMAIEAGGQLVAAMADAHSLEAAGASILDPLEDGRLGSKADPWRGMVALDGNLTPELLGQIARGDWLATADLRIAPASPGKVTRLRPFLGHAKATLYVNLEEAGLLSGQPWDNSADAAQDLHRRGLGRAVVTNGEDRAAVASDAGLFQAVPPKVDVRRVTGAGDTFMAAHMAAEFHGADEEEALLAALDLAARFVATEDPL